MFQRFAAGTLVLVIAGFQGTVWAQEAASPILWGLQKSEPVRYQVEQTARGRVPFGPLAFELNVSATIDLTWQVVESAANGRPATIEETITRVQLKSSGLSGSELAYDTASPPKQPDKAIESYRPALERLHSLIDRPFYFQMDPTGKVVGELPAELTRDLDNPKSYGPFAALLNPQNLRLLLGIELLRLPPDGLAPGQVWSVPPADDERTKGDGAANPMTVRRRESAPAPDIAIIDVFANAEKPRSDQVGNRVILFDTAKRQIKYYIQKDIAQGSLVVAGQELSDNVFTRDTKMTLRSPDESPAGEPAVNVVPRPQSRRPASFRPAPTAR